MMQQAKPYAFHDTFHQIGRRLLTTGTIHRGEWHAMDVSASPHHATRELLHVSVTHDMSEDLSNIGADTEWADEHFAERIGGVPVNPPPSHVRWPHAVRGNADHTTPSGAFDHTYPERFWPKWASKPPNHPEHKWPIHGIRFAYGDLGDVVALLNRNVLTRQAFLPVWFPEDTGAAAGQRVPCTIGYHFIVTRLDTLDMVYYIRSCDMFRHFRNDVYLAVMLGRWMCERITANPPVTPGNLIMHITSLHSFVADDRRLADAIRQA
jgi:thymidylate synthase